MVAVITLGYTSASARTVTQDAGKYIQINLGAAVAGKVLPQGYPLLNTPRVQRCLWLNTARGPAKKFLKARRKLS